MFFMTCLSKDQHGNISQHQFVYRLYIMLPGTGIMSPDLTVDNMNYAAHAWL